MAALSLGFFCGICGRCAENGANSFGKKFAGVFKAGWYADHLNKVEQRSNRSLGDVMRDMGR